MRFSLLLVLALAACTSAPKAPGVDVVWNRVADPQAVCEGLSGRKEFFRVLGCSKWNEVNADGARVCSIYAPMPRDERDVQRLATLGHELMHCFEGNWHDRWGHMKSERLAGHDHQLPRLDARVGAMHGEGEIDVQHVAERSAGAQDAQAEADVGEPAGRRIR